MAALSFGYANLQSVRSVAAVELSDLTMETLKWPEEPVAACYSL